MGGRGYRRSKGVVLRRARTRQTSKLGRQDEVAVTVWKLLLDDAYLFSLPWQRYIQCLVLFCPGSALFYAILTCSTRRRASHVLQQGKLHFTESQFALNLFSLSFSTYLSLSVFREAIFIRVASCHLNRCKLGFINVDRIFSNSIPM